MTIDHAGREPVPAGREPQPARNRVGPAPVRAKRGREGLRTLAGPPHEAVARTEEPALPRIAGEPPQRPLYRPDARRRAGDPGEPEHGAAVRPARSHADDLAAFRRR